MIFNGHITRVRNLSGPEAPRSFPVMLLDSVFRSVAQYIFEWR